MKKLMILFCCAMLSACASAPKPEGEESDLIEGTGFCVHPMFGTFEWEGKPAEYVRFQKGTFILKLDDGRRIQLIGAVCRIKEDAAPVK
jgi:hypothetical protein